MRRPAATAAALAASAAGTFAKNDYCKNHAGGGVLVGRRRRSVARSVGPLPNFRRRSQPGSLWRAHGNAARAPRATVPRPPTRELRNLRAGTGQAAAAAPAKEKGGDGADEGERERRGKKGEKGILKKATAMARRFRHIRTIHSALPRAIAAFPLFWEMSQNTLPL